MADAASIEYKTNSCVLTQSMASRRWKRDFGQNFQNFDFWGQNFLRIFLPFGSVGFCLRAWPWGRGSRGWTPLLVTAFYGIGSGSVVERLLEAKAAVDAKENEHSRGLGRRIWGGTRGRGWNVDGSDLWCTVICLFLWKVFQNTGTNVRCFSSSMFSATLCLQQ